jgi:hypothetical protein
MKNLISLLRHFLHLGVTFPIPTGIVADESAAFGLFGLMQAVNFTLFGPVVQITTAAGASTAVTAAQFWATEIDFNAGAGGGFALQLPSTAALIAALPLSIPLDGTYAKVLHYKNNNVGQTGTLTAGDAGTTITGTATIATNIVRIFVVTVTSPTTITIENFGGRSL